MKVIKECDYCQLEFATYERLIKLGRGKYCSRKCYELAKRKQGVNSKICSRCESDKPISEFSKRNRDGLCNAICKVCCSEISQRHIRKVKTRWLNSKSSAIKRKGDGWWGVIENEYASLMSQKCHYCGGELNLTGVGLDRKQNDLGYVRDNVVPCCKQCNVVKNNFFTYEEMMFLSPVLETIREARIAKCIL